VLTQSAPAYAPSTRREPEVTLDRSIDRRVLLRLRKEFPSSNFPARAHGRGIDADMETMGETVEMEI